jgi:hypothetical protein
MITAPQKRENAMQTNMPEPETKAETTNVVPPGLHSPAATGQGAVQVWMDMGTEVARFLWDRVQQDIKTQQALLGCTSLQEIQKIQTAYVTAAQAQYAAEAGKMLALMGRAAAAGLAASAKGRRYDDVPL